jgi:hypothetical protein
VHRTFQLATTATVTTIINSPPCEIRGITLPQLLFEPIFSSPLQFHFDSFSALDTGLILFAAVSPFARGHGGDWSTLTQFPRLPQGCAELRTGIPARKKWNLYLVFCSRGGTYTSNYTASHVDLYRISRLRIVQGRNPQQKNVIQNDAMGRYTAIQVAYLHSVPMDWTWKFDVQFAILCFVAWNEEAFSLQTSPYASACLPLCKERQPYSESSSLFSSRLELL